MSEFTDAFFSVPDGLTLHYRDYPGDRARPPLLCLPGLTRNARDFAAIAEHVAPRFRVIVLEFRGRGLSDRDPQPDRYRPGTYAQDTLALLDNLRIDRAIFLGTSLGGIVTMLIAVTAGARIAGAILNDVGPELSEDGLARIRDYVGNDRRFDSWQEAGSALAAQTRNIPTNYGDAEWVRMAQRVCQDREDGIAFDYDMAIAEPFNRAGPTEKVNMWPLFKALAAHPLLVIRGGLSDLLSAAALAKMHDTAPAMASVTVPGVGHAPDLEEPDAVAAIDAFLARFAA